MGLAKKGVINGAKQKIYDEQIEPLKKQIEEICEEYGIPTVSAYILDEDEDNTAMGGRVLIKSSVESDPDTHRWPSAEAVRPLAGMAAFTLSEENTREQRAYTLGMATALLSKEVAELVPMAGVVLGVMSADLLRRMECTGCESPVGGDVFSSAPAGEAN